MKVSHEPQPAVARVAEILTQPMAGPSNASNERKCALQGMNFDLMCAYFLNLNVVAWLHLNLTLGLAPHYGLSR